MTRRAWILVVAGLATLTIGLVGLGSDGLAELNLRKIVLEPPSAVTRGEVVTVRAWVMNTGERPAGEFKAEFFYRRQSEAESWTSFYTVIIPNLPPSQQDPLEIRDDGHAIGLDTSSLELGTYEIRVVADSNNLIPEWDKTNNELVTTLTVLASRKGLPDLQPTSLSFNPPSPTSGELVVVSSEIRNTGDRDAGGFRVAFFVDDREFDGTALEGLAVGGSVTAQGALDPYALALGPGSHTLRVAADSLGKVEEQDEANNQLAAYLTIEGADLFPVSLEFGRSLVRADEQVGVSSRVRNLGRGEAKGVEVAFLIDGVQFGLANLGTLGPGAEAVASGELLPGRADLALAPGVHEVRIVVDPHGLVSETDKANNVAVKSLTLLPEERKLAELHPESLELNLPSPVELGKANAVTVSSVIKNTGKALAKGFAVEFGYRMKGTLRWETMPCRDPVGCDRLDLAPGAEMKVEGTFLISSVVPGIYEVRVAVDPHEGCNQVACGDYRPGRGDRRDKRRTGYDPHSPLGAPSRPRVRPSAPALRRAGELGETGSNASSRGKPREPGRRRWRPVRRGVLLRLRAATNAAAWGCLSRGLRPALWVHSLRHGLRPWACGGERGFCPGAPRDDRPAPRELSRSRGDRSGDLRPPGRASEGAGRDEQPRRHADPHPGP